VTSARRGYLRGDARLNAYIISGTRRAGGEQRRRPHHRRSGSKSTSTIEGFQVTTQTSPVFVIIAITLGPDAMFNLLFNNGFRGRGDDDRAEVRLEGHSATGQLARSEGEPG